MKHRQHNYLTTMYEIAGRKRFFYKDVGPALKLKYGVNGAIMRKLVEDKVVKIVSKTHKRKNGQVMPQYQITNIGVEIVNGIRHRAGRYG
jgi:Tfp pilus assembly ATPase PilU